MRVLLPIATLLALLTSLVTFWAGADASGLVYLLVFAVLLLVWAIEQERRQKKLRRL